MYRTQTHLVEDWDSTLTQWTQNQYAAYLGPKCILFKHHFLHLSISFSAFYFSETLFFVLPHEFHNF